MANRGGRTAASLHHVGRPALGRSVYAGSVKPGGGPSPDRTAVCAADVSSRVHPTLGQPLTPQPDDTESVKAHPGRGDGRAGDGRQSSGPRGGTANRSQDRWRALVCRRVDQNGGGIRVTDCNGQPL